MGLWGLSFRLKVSWSSDRGTPGLALPGHAFLADMRKSWGIPSRNSESKATVVVSIVWVREGRDEGDGAQEDGEDDFGRTELNHGKKKGVKR